MIPERRLRQWLGRLLVVLPFVAVGVGGWLLYGATRLSLPTASAPQGGQVVIAPPAALDGHDWSLVYSASAQAGPAGGALARRFRLAGTFFALGAGENTRKAILDDLVKGGQHIVSESQRIDDVDVLRVMADRVVLRRGTDEAELWLGFTGPPPVAGTEGEAAVTDGGNLEAFGGRQTGTNSYVFSRERLADYYQEVLDDPERLVQVFDSLKNVRDASGRTRGYRVDIEGERAFFNAVGLRNGDVVRKVNGMDMTSRRRAEYLLGEFARNRANAFVLEVDRNGSRQKLTYQIRE